VTSAAVLAEVRWLAGAGRVRFTAHAKQRMRERGVYVDDVLHALRNAFRCRLGDKQSKWKVTGADTDGDDLTLVVVIDEGILVVTVF
jgi:hypothetical protein